MTGTSKALKRLGVAGLSAALMSVGLVPFATMANASSGHPTTATSTAISPTSDTAPVGDCNPYTVTVPEGASVTVQISQAVSRATDGVTTGIDFCVPASGANDSTPTNAAPIATPGSTTAVNGAAGVHCYNNTAPPAGGTNTLSCQQDYLDTADADHTVVIGVTSSETGTMNIQTWGDLNGNGAVDVNEQASVAHATKTWVARTVTKIDCSPKTATNPTNTQHQFTCTATGASDVTISGADVRFYVQSGPDAAAYPASPGHPCGTFAALNNSDTPTTNGTDSSGTATCRVNNGGVPGTDQIYVWVESNSIAGPQGTETNTTVSKQWVNAAPSGSQVSVTCSPNQTETTGTAPNQGATCQDPLSDTSATFTATVVNGVPAQPQAGVLVQWSISANNGGGPGEPVTPSNEAETLSASSCTTAANGTCSVTLNDPTPTEGEAIQVQASVATQGLGGPSTAVGTKVWHNPDPDESRNITVEPATQSASSGGAATLLATVTDRFANPVEGEFVGWTESGPGAFRSGSFCFTNADGQCSIEVSSLGSEKGADTVTATLDGTPASTDECNAPADKSQYDATGYNASAATVSTNAGSPSGTTFTNTATGAPAGNCSADATVTWGSPPPSGKQAMHLHLACFSHHKGKIKCVAQAAPAIAGLTVKFFNKKGHKVAEDITNKAGKAHFIKTGKKSGKTYTFQAHLKSSAHTYAADSKRAKVTVQ